MEAPAVRVGVLGPTTIQVAGEPVDLGSLKQRALLAVLALGGGHPVTVDRIVDALWGASPPPGVVTTLHGYVASLRRLLEPGRAPRTQPTVLVTAPGGYALKLAARALDADDFTAAVDDVATVLKRIPDHQRPVAAVADRGSLTAAYQLLEDVVARWRGTPYADLGDLELAQAERQRLREVLLGARISQAVIQLALGEHAAAANALESLSLEHPLREQLWALRAVALTRGGRQADALETLQTLRETLAGELGLDPGPQVQQLQQDILNQHESLTAAAPAPRAAVPGAVPLRFPWPLVGRGQELAAFERALDRAESGWTQFGMVAGEAGIGKSRLLREVAVRAVDRGFLHVEGRCSSDDGAPPLWALRQVLAVIGPACGIAVPDLGALSETPGTEAAAAQFALVESIAAALRAASEVRPLMVVVEDVHWADASTLRVLRHLAEHPGNHRLLLCATLRPDEGDTAELVYALARTEAVRLDLGGLDAAESAALVTAVAGVDTRPQDGPRLLERTGGNPFFLSEIARTGDPLDGAGSGSVADVVGQRVRLLPAATYEVLEAASVVDRVFDPALVAQAAGISPAQLAERLAPARAAGLVVDDTDGKAAFAHALVRDAILTGSRVATREQWHARVARSLEDRSGSGISEHTEIAFHWRRAGYAHVARAWRAAVVAAEKAREVFASEEEARLLAQALESQRLDVLSTDRERYDLLMLHASASRVAADWEAAAADVTQAIATAERMGDPVLAAEASIGSVEGAVWHARTYGTVLGDLVAALRRALDSLPPGDSELRCRVMLSLAAEGYYDTPREETDVMVAEALAIAERLGDPRLLVVAHQLGFSARWRPETAAWRLETARRSYELSLGLGDVNLEVTSRSFLAIALAELGHVVESRALIGPTIELARAHGILTAVTILELLQGPMMLLAGEDDAAEASIARLLDLAERVTVPNMGHAVAAMQSVAVLWQGRYDELMASLSELVAQKTVPVDSFVVVLLLRVGADDLARQTHGMRPAELDDHDYMGMIQHCLAAEIALRLDEPGLGAQVYSWLTPYAGRLCSAGSTTVMGPVDAFLALAAASSGELEAARRHADDAVALCTAWGFTRVTGWLEELRSRYGF